MKKYDECSYLCFISLEDAVELIKGLIRDLEKNTDSAYISILKEIGVCLKAEIHGMHLWNAPLNCYSVLESNPNNPVKDLLYYNTNSKKQLSKNPIFAHMESVEHFVSRKEAIETLCYLKDAEDFGIVDIETQNQITDIITCIFMETAQYHIWGRPIDEVSLLFGTSYNQDRKNAKLNCKFTPAIYEKGKITQPQYDLDFVRTYMPNISFYMTLHTREA